MTWLLDTNTWIYFLKGSDRHVAARLEACQEGDVVICSVVKAELWHGALRYGNPRRRLARLRELFQRHSSLPFDDAAAWHYCQIRHGLESQGQRIGPNDLMIAAICRARNLTLVTSNTREFARVGDLIIEDWRQIDPSG